MKKRHSHHGRKRRWRSQLFPGWALFFTLIPPVTVSLLMCPLQVVSQTAPLELKISHYTEKDGLSRNTAQTIIQDHSGFLWIGTQDGLNRFDGTEFKVYDKDISDVTDYKLGTVVALAEDSLGNIWIGTVGGLCRLDPSTDRIQDVEVPGLTNPMINSILVQNRTHLWIGSWYHLHRFDMVDSTFEVYELGAGWDDRYNQAVCLAMLNDSVLCYGGATGLYSLNIKTRSINHDIEKIGYVSSLQKFDDEQILLTSLRKGAMLFDYRSCTILKTLVCTVPFEKTENRFVGAVMDAVVMRDNTGTPRLWASGGYGIMSIDDTLNYHTCYDFWTGLPTTVSQGVLTYDILDDRENNIWITSREGLAKIEFNKSAFEKISESNVIAMHACQNEKNKYWLINKDGHVGLFDKSMGAIINSYYADPSPVKGHFVFAFTAESSDDGIWIGGIGRFYYFDFITKTFTTVLYDHQNALDDRLTTGMKLSKDGTLWLITSKGMTHYDPSSKRLVDYFDSLDFFRPEDTGLYGLLLDDQGRVWIHGDMKEEFQVLDTNKNLFRSIQIVDADGKNEPTSRAQNFFQDSEGHIWLTSMTGLYLYNEQKERFEHTDLGIPSGTMMDMVSDSAGRLWTFYYKRVFVFDPADSSVFQYTVYDGLSENEISSIGYIPETNEIYLDHWGGHLIIFNPEMLHPARIGNLLLTEFRLLGRDSVLQPDQNITLPHKDNDIRFGYKLLDFKSEYNTIYSIMLEGADDGWNRVGRSTTATYSNLPEGDYRFWVKAEKLSGDYTAPVLLSEFTIKAPYYRTIWFKAIAIIVLASVLLSLYFFRVNQLKRTIRVRSKISSDLHDDIGSALTSIRVYSEMARKQPDPRRLSGVLDKIEETAGDMIQSMSDIVWMVNPKYDDFAFVIQRMENFAAEFLSLREIQYTISKENGVETVRLPMDKRKNLYLIFKEILNNAAKHSQCKSIRIHFEHAANTLLMKVIDDGDGFDLKSQRNGNGLSNMQERVSESGGFIQINSESTKGTQITVQIPV